jgi:hypothetical protein
MPAAVQVLFTALEDVKARHKAGHDAGQAAADL